MPAKRQRPRHVRPPGRSAGSAPPRPPRFIWLTLPLALGAVIWYAFHAGVLCLTYPPPWPDEALFADVAANLLRHGRLSTELYAEFFPAMRQHYYLTPPLHHVLTAGWFALFGVGIGALRGFSALAAAGVLGATFAVGRRVGLSRTMALLPSALLALDAVFLRASLLGRMDMLTLLLILATVWLALGGASVPGSDAGTSSWSRRAFLLGITSALAVLAHPLGAVAVAVTVGWVVAAVFPATSGRGPSLAAGRPARLVLLPALLGLGLGLLPWALYAARDVHAFVEQIAGQLLRKSSRDWGSCFRIAAQQWGVDPGLVVGALLSGAAGLALAGIQRSPARLVLAVQLLTALVVLPSCEIWYPVYLMPLTYVGVGCALSRLNEPRLWRRGLAIAIAVLALYFAQQNLARVSALRGSRHLFEEADGDYFAWCRALGEFLPARSTVLLDGLPTPYFGLADRQDLALRFFPPAGFDVSESRVLPFLEQIDYIVSGRALANPEVRSFAISRGVLVAEIGERQGPGYYAAVIRVPHGPPAR